MARNKKIQWQLILFVSFGIQILLVVCHVLFVTYYSMLIDTGHSQEFYNQFAQNTGTAFVFFFAPLPIFFNEQMDGD